MESHIMSIVEKHIAPVHTLLDDLAQRFQDKCHTMKAELDKMEHLLDESKMILQRLKALEEFGLAASFEEHVAIEQLRAARVIQRAWRGRRQ